jgi:predicted O-methyltransferase YrrM
MRRTLRAGLSSLLGLSSHLGKAPPGFFIPHQHTDLADATRGRYDTLGPLFRDAEPSMRDFLGIIESFAPDLKKIGNAPPPAPRWEQDWFPRLDGAALYATVRHLAPKRIIEIGSGHSTRFMVQAVADGKTGTEITSIDPSPRADIADLPINHVAKPVQKAGAATFSALEPGDLLFIDSSHILMPGTDVDYLFNRVLPVLPPGVWIHVHDVLLPEDYPELWAWRGYNEQLAVAALLQGGGYEIFFSSAYAVTALKSAIKESVVNRLPLVDGAFETSIWLQKVR